MSLDPAAYAAELRAYAGSVLDPGSLRSWLIQRLMLDLGVDHDRAACLAGEALERDVELARQLGLSPRPRRLSAFMRRHTRPAILYI